MNLEPTIQSEVSQKDKYCIQHIYMESRKMVLKNLFKGNNGETDRIDLWTWGKGRRGCDVWRE